MSVANNGDLFIAGEKERDNGISNIYHSKFIAGKYMKPKALYEEVNSPKYKDFAPFVSPGQKVLMFSSMDRPDSYGGADLYISFRSKEGGWEKAMNMGAEVNSDHLECWPAFSPDAKWLFFVSDRNGKDKIYWLDTAIVEQLKQKSNGD
jgi:Tol biopolymer transport system component